MRFSLSTSAVASSSFSGLDKFIELFIAQIFKAGNHVVSAVRRPAAQKLNVLRKLVERLDEIVIFRLGKFLRELLDHFSSMGFHRFDHGIDLVLETNDDA